MDVVSRSDSRCPIVDTWWQTETGGILDHAAAWGDDNETRLGNAAVFGIKSTMKTTPWTVLLTAISVLQMRTVYGDHRFIQTYFTTFPGRYFTGDGCRRDADGYYWITGRVDDVINVSGHRMGTAEDESALVAHQSPRPLLSAIRMIASMPYPQCW